MAYENYRAVRKILPTPFNKHELWCKTAKALKLPKEALIRLEWIIFYETKADRNASLTSRHFGIGLSTFHKWRKRFNRTLKNEFLNWAIFTLIQRYLTESLPY